METIFGMIIFLPAVLTIAGICIFFGQCISELRRDREDEAIIRQTRDRIAKARMLVRRNLEA